MKLEEACAQMDLNLILSENLSPFARWVVVPFYRAKSTIYNTWLMGT
jgi:hypothetical protein